MSHCTVVVVFLPLHFQHYVMAAIVCETGGGGGGRAAGGRHAAASAGCDRGSVKALAWCRPKAFDDGPAEVGGSSEPAASVDVEYIPLAAAAN